MERFFVTIFDWITFFWKEDLLKQHIICFVHMLDL